MLESVLLFMNLFSTETLLIILVILLLFGGVEIEYAKFVDEKGECVYLRN